MLVVPLGVIGALAATSLRGLSNDVHFQIAPVTTIGLSAKNAILIIEFAEKLQLEGLRLHEATLQAVRIRLRPILMTSLAFMMGVMPLALSTGAGSGHLLCADVLHTPAGQAGPYAGDGNGNGNKCGASGIACLNSLPATKE